MQGTNIKILCGIAGTNPRGVPFSWEPNRVLMVGRDIDQEFARRLVETEQAIHEKPARKDSKAEVQAAKADSMPDAPAADEQHPVNEPKAKAEKKNRRKSRQKSNEV